MNEVLIKNILTEELFGYSSCQSTQDLNIINYFYSNLLLEKILVGEPLDVNELRKLLRKKIVNFEFIKLNGEVRPSVGTTMMKYIPQKDHPRGIRPSSPKVATFYDLDKDAWRSVSRRSKEIVLKKDEKTDKPIVVVKDRSKIKVKPLPKERDSKDPIIQGQTYKYTTNRGTNTYVEILRELVNGLYQVSSPVFKTTFAIDPSRIGNKIKTKEEKSKEKEEVKGKETKIKEPEKEKKPLEKPKPSVQVKPIIKKQTKPEQETTVLLPKEIKAVKTKEETKAPPRDITPEEPEELTK